MQETRTENHPDVGLQYGRVSSSAAAHERTGVHRWLARLSLAVVLLIIAASAGDCAADLSRGLVAWYPFEGDLRDWSRERNHGVPNGNLGFVPGMRGEALKLGGISTPGYVAVENSPALAFQDQFTVACFLRIDAPFGQTSADCSGGAVDEAPQCVFAKRGDRAGLFFNVYVHPAQNKLETAFGINSYAPPDAKVVGLVSYTLGTWVHFAIVYNSGQLTEYLDGVEVARHAGPPVNLSTVNTEDLFIGIQNDAGGACLTWWYPLDGAIDELTIYNRALTVQEVDAFVHPASSSVGALPETGAARAAESGPPVDSAPTTAGSLLPSGWSTWIIVAIVVLTLLGELIRNVGGT